MYEVGPINSPNARQGFISKFTSSKTLRTEYSVLDANCTAAVSSGHLGSPSHPRIDGIPMHPKITTGHGLLWLAGLVSSMVGLGPWLVGWRVGCLRTLRGASSAREGSLSRPLALHWAITSRRFGAINNPHIKCANSHLCQAWWWLRLGMVRGRDMRDPAYQLIACASAPRGKDRPGGAGRVLSHVHPGRADGSGFGSFLVFPESIVESTVRSIKGDARHVEECPGEDRSAPLPLQRAWNSRSIRSRPSPGQDQMAWESDRGYA